MTPWLQPELTTLAFIWRLDRADGVALGFTSHDRDLVVAGFRYRATPGMVPSAIEWSDGFDADTVQLAGALTSDAIVEADLLAGRWDGARLRLSAVDWTNPDADPLFLVRGEFGGVEFSGDAFSVELRGPANALGEPVVEETSPECRASLGDRRCRADMAARRRIVTVSAYADAALTLASALPDNLFASGHLLWIDGPNAGLRGHIVANAGTSLTLAEPPFAEISTASRAEISEGCDRRFATCASRFQNAVNFQGEPHLPGNDLLTRYVV